MVKLKRNTQKKYSKVDWDLMFTEAYKNTIARGHVNLLMEHYGYSNYDAVEEAYFKICICTLEVATNEI